MSVFCFYVPVSGSNNVADPGMTYAVVKRKEKGSLHYVSSTLLLTCVYFLAEQNHSRSVVQHVHTFISALKYFK